ncbi:MAG: response regulator (plasmid) [Candidatus Manganitrophus sp.]|nr:response regulator [Candidatus Manganitrophus sp.]MDC4228224.1 response regulator [Candidatus Manganitrophus sp.]WDT73519.1 MAG: response regulator [Candidatus Manganitrophus sp.]WDT77791.1 MAG: response regulator [Candidatus Manganitrophus sp.]WDT82823.1 MAG: response regulator [Candidatus Manganitrophus sp.]
MRKSLHVLVVEDSEDDTLLIVNELQQIGYDLSYKRVETPKAMDDALCQAGWDLIVSDYFMPRFSAPEALKLVKKAGLEIPFIIITGSVGEDIAVAAMKAGAHDYLMKDNLARLCPAIERELKEAESRRERKRAEEALKESREQLRNLAARMDSLREKERTWIAREVHDQLGQVFTSIKIDLSLMQKALARSDRSGEKTLALLHEKIASMSHLVDAAIRTVQKIGTQLRPGVLDDLGLVAAIEWQTKAFQTRTGISCRIKTNLQIVDLDRDRATAVFRIFQEILTNVARHAKATRVDILVEEENRQLFLDVEDNGLGISNQEISNPTSLGLLGMRERALLFNGEISISGISGKGTKVGLRIPLKKRGADRKARKPSI